MMEVSVLLVDDEVPFVETLVKRLEKRNLKVAAAFGGQEALDTLDNALVRYSDDARLYGVRASLYLEQGKVSEALGDLESALRLDPDDALNLTNRAQAYRRFGRGDLLDGGRRHVDEARHPRGVEGPEAHHEKRPARDDSTSPDMISHRLRLLVVK